jgi:UDP-glucose 4-epimerase
MTTTYLVTGGTGFIGAHVARQLVDRGREVVLFDVAPREDRVADVRDDVTIVRGDIRRPEQLARVFEAHDVDRVCHLASLLGSESEADPPRSIGINVEGTGYVYDLAATHGVDRVVNTSSIAVYGYHPPDAVERVTEDAPRRPNILYASCKLLNEDLGKRYAEEDGMTVSTVRFGSVFGPGRDTGASGFTTAIVENPANGDPVTVPGVGEPNWLYVEDAAAGVVHLAEEHAGGGYEDYNLASEIASLHTAADLVRDRVPDADITVTDAAPETLPGVWMRMDTAKLEAAGFTPEYDLEAGIEAHLAALGA